MSMPPSIYHGGRSVRGPYYQQPIWDPSQDFWYGSNHLLAVAPPPPPPLFSTGSRFELKKLDWNETPEAHVFRAELPRLQNEMKMEVDEGRVLCIRGEKRAKKEATGEMWNRVERSSGSFERRFRLPEDAEIDKLTASLENGVLTVTVPKKESKHHGRRTVDIYGGG